jgi:Protein of unknown function (DUF4232)
MRSSKKLSAVALVVLAAGLSLTACDSDGSRASGTATSSASAPTQHGSVQTEGSAHAARSAAAKHGDHAADGAAGGSGSRYATCRSDDLSLYAAVSPEAKGDTGVQISNDGEQTCTMEGFPEVDLVSAGGFTLHAQAADEPAHLVTLRPGDMSVFHLSYPAHAAPGSELVDFDKLTVTTPDGQHSQTLEIDGGPVALPEDAHVTVTAVQ